MPETTRSGAYHDEFTVAGMIRHLAALQPDHEMLVSGEIRRSWAEEYARASQVAQACLRDGVDVGDRLAFLDRNGAAYFDVLFGGSLVGAVNVAVNWRLAPVEMSDIINDAKARILFVHTDYLDALSQMSSPLSTVERVVVVSEGGHACLHDRGRRSTRSQRGLRSLPMYGSRHLVRHASREQGVGRRPWIRVHPALRPGSRCRADL